ncbi:MAG: hypothetical protein RR265_01265, partial [Cetobacterium sp.]|uniref:hypothetical protein n=1 Tax=Cetobacterium sp. TaxID=2071632 RepID=UPI002FC9B15C
MRLYEKHQIIHFLKNAFYSMLIAFLISLFAHLVAAKKLEVLDTVLSSIKIFFSILPLVFLSQKNFLFRDGPLKAIFLVFYYLVLVPIINLSLKIDSNEALNYFFILLTFINI